MIPLRDAAFPPAVLRSVAVGFYQLVRLIETRVLRRFQPASGA
jgi:hypothetical protein